MDGPSVHPSCESRTFAMVKAGGDDPARLLAWHAPGFGQFFLDLADLAKGQPDPTQIAALMRRWNMDVPGQDLPT